MTDHKMGAEAWHCPECGIGVRADEDGCCAVCGRDCRVAPAQWTAEAIPIDSDFDNLIAGLIELKRAGARVVSIGTCSSEQFGRELWLCAWMIAATVLRIDD